MLELKKLREDAGLSQNQLAKMCGKVRQTIGMIESGQNKPSIELAKKFGEIFGVEWKNFFE